MKYSEAKMGRTFVIRLEDGDILHESIERFAKENRIQAAALIIIGGADEGSRMVVGPAESRADAIISVTTELQGVHEVTGTGTIFPNGQGEPILHMHLAAGRGEETRTGCVRVGVKTWHVLEVILFELLESSGRRLPDAATGFELLCP